MKLVHYDIQTKDRASTLSPLHAAETLKCATLFEILRANVWCQLCHLNDGMSQPRYYLVDNTVKQANRQDSLAHYILEMYDLQPTNNWEKNTSTIYIYILCFD